MSRREIVLLVSRAIAILQIIPALFELFISLPQQFFFTVLPVLRERAQSPYAATRSPDLLMTIQWSSLGFTLLRIAVLLIIGALFWTCGPMVEQLLTGKTRGIWRLSVRRDRPTPRGRTLTRRNIWREGRQARAAQTT